MENQDVRLDRSRMPLSLVQGVGVDQGGLNGATDNEDQGVLGSLRGQRPCRISLAPISALTIVGT
jgi:hypothetical protein